jgi:hypothetical protein
MVVSVASETSFRRWYVEVFVTSLLEVGDGQDYKCGTSGAVAGDFAAAGGEWSVDSGVL